MTKSSREHNDEGSEHHAEQLPRVGVTRERHEGDDADRVQEVGHRQRKIGDQHWVLFLERLIPFLPRAQHHRHRDDQQHDAAGDGEGADREVQEPGQELTQQQKEDGDDACRR